MGFVLLELLSSVLRNLPGLKETVFVVGTVMCWLNVYVVLIACLASYKHISLNPMCADTTSYFYYSLQIVQFRRGRTDPMILEVFSSVSISTSGN